MATLTLRNSDGLAEESSTVLAELARLEWTADFYLAGSGALTLYLHHRPIRDLDLMSQVRRLRSNERRDLLQDLLAMDPELRVETARDGFLYVRSGSGAGLRFYYYPYPLVDPEDFVDLFLLCREIALATLLDRSLEKFGHVGDFPLQALKGLVDFSQISGEPMPKLLGDLHWDSVADWLHDEVKTLGRRYVGLDSTKKE
jgi:hypothetical protein